MYLTVPAVQQLMSLLNHAMLKIICCSLGWSKSQGDMSFAKHTRLISEPSVQLVFVDAAMH